MPLFKLKKVWEYCLYNKPFFVFILLVMYLLNWFPQYYTVIFRPDMDVIIQSIIAIFLSGYGLSITRDRINHGYRLPKIMLGEVFNLGIKSFVVYLVFFGFQWFILMWISIFFSFPVFDLEEMLFNFDETLALLIVTDLFNSIAFLILSAIGFYITTFFAEISLARLADTKSLLSAFNLKAIFKSIHLFGWRNYTRDVTSIILAIVILTYLKSVAIPNLWINSLWGMFFGFLIFATQFLGIGAVYCRMKDMEQELSQSDLRE